MGFSVIAATTPSNDAPLQVGQRADDAPRMQLFKVSHVSEARRASVLPS